MRKMKRMVALLLASVMILTSQSVATAAEVAADTSTQENIAPESTEAEVQKSDTEEASETKASTADAEEPSETKNNSEVSSADEASKEAKNTSETPEPKELTLTDEQTGVQVTGMDNVLPEGAVLSADEKKEKEDADYPAQAKEDIAAKLEQENLSLTDIAFYDISLGGGQPSGKIEVRFPVPGDWDGELDAWYIDEQGNVTNMDGEKNASENYFAFQTDHFSLYALSVSGPKEEENNIEETQPADEKKDEEQTAEPAPQNAEPKDGDEDTNGQTFAEAAESHYGEGGTTATASATIQYEGTGNTVKAGQTISFLIDYWFDSAIYYNYGEHSQPLFDSYDDSKIILHLPEGMSVVEGVEGTLQNVTKVEGPAEGSNDWTLFLNNKISADSDSTGSFLVTIQIGGNGSTEIGHVYDLSDLMDIETSFTIKDRTNPDQITDGKTYKKKVPTSSTLEDLTSVTGDSWMVKKSASGTPVVSNDKKTVTVRFTLEVGLEEGGDIVTQANTYGRTGRVPFANGNTISLKETPVVKDRDGNAIQAQSITVTPDFGTKTPITFDSAGATMSIPVDTCAGKGISLDVDPNAPYYSRYLVEMVYPYDDFIAQYYDENQEQLTVTNTAEIQYALKTNGGTLPDTSTSTAQQKAGEVTKPAELTLGKIINHYDTNVPVDYIWANFGDMEGLAEEPVKGPVVYEIKGENGTTPTLYIKEGDTYKELTGANGQVTYDPSTDQNNQTGEVTVYLDPGTYIVTEQQGPANTSPVAENDDKDHNAEPKTFTIAAGEKETATFYNKEQLGQINILKRGEQNGQVSVLKDAVFGLYTDASCSEDSKVAEVKTNADGTASFTRLLYETEYYVKEISAPSGYIKDDTVYGSYTLSAEKDEVTVESLNEYNLAPIVLQKQVYNPNTGRYDNVIAANAGVFKKCFQILRKAKDGDTWTPVEVTGGETLISLGEDGTIRRQLPVYEGDGKTLITYKIVEYLPEGWHADGEILEGGKRVVYTDDFTLGDYLGNSAQEAYELKLENDRNGSIELTKKFYQATAGGMTETKAQDLTATFDLYYKDGSDELKKYEEGSSYTVAAGQSVSITDLPRTGDGGADREYWLVETSSQEGYKPSENVTGTNAASGQTLNIDGKDQTAFGPFNFNKSLEEGKENIVLEQSVTISNVEQKVPVVVKKVNSYNVNQFVPGAGYTIYEYNGTAEDNKGTQIGFETKITSSAGALSKLDPGKKYLVVETTVPQGYENVNTSDSLIIDLTTTLEVGTTTPVETVTLLNRPDPTITVDKARKNAAGNDTDLKGVTFEVYTKEEGSNSFTRVLGYDDQPLTITSGTATQIPAGEYYLKEVVGENPNSVLDPSKYPDVYKDVEGIKAEDGFYFGPFEVEQQKDAKTIGPLVNYSDEGAVTVTKLQMMWDGSTQPLEGAEIGIYNGDKQVVAATSAADTGHATFTGLPIYDEDGEKITYTIKELTAPDGYTKSDDILKVQLTPGETVETDTEGEDLKLINQPETSLQVYKTYYNVWEHAFTNKQYELPGAVIALYVENADGDYELVGEPQTTDVAGNVFFNGLTQKDHYVAIEVCVPKGEAYQYLEPIAPEKEYLNPDYLTNGDLPKEIKGEDLANYYYVEKEANTGNPVEKYWKQMVNVENWAQLQIEKFVYEDEEHQEHPYDKRKINNAQFTLYMQIVDPDSTTLAFDLTQNPDSYTEIGTYSSGTLYDVNGVRMDGWFGTDVLKSADNVVYWLVETYAGIGADFNPKNVVTLIHREGTNYTNVTEYELEGEIVHPTYDIKYVDNKVTTGEIENLPLYGGAPAMFSTVRIAKWAGARNQETGKKIYEYTPLGNASFDLYLADSQGNLYNKLDTMTTGLDNNVGQQDEPLSAWASSRAFSWKELTGLYEKELSAELYQDIFTIDGDGNGYVRVAIVESDAPVGYTMDKRNTYYMYMFFEYDKEKVTEIFNDAYYVKGDEEEAPDVELAENQEGTQWALYPTEETAEGGYTGVGEMGTAPQDAVTDQYRLVNWPIDKWAVTVQKYGYEVQDANLNRNSEELNDYYAFGGHTDRTPLSVTMRLERYVGGKWSPYAYTTNPDHANGQFKTDGSGYFAFPEGLPMGIYRIVEVTPAAGYENIYDGTAITNGGAGQDKAAYYFQVDTENVHITMYNPKKLSLNVTKTDMEDQPLKDTTFTLTDQTDSSNKIEPAKTDEKGVARLENIGTGTYKLTETATSGYVDSYFSKYFAAAYSDTATYKNLNDLVNGNGIFLGYKTSLKAGEFGTSVQVEQVTDISDYGIDTEKGITVTVKNPKEISFSIRKADADTGAYKNGAQFKVEYLPFGTLSGEITVTSASVEWQDKGTKTTAGTEGTTKGLATVTGEPGIYRITETKAPDGYDITSTQPQYVAMTGGLDIKKVTVDGTEIRKDTNVPLEFEDDQQVSLTVTKTIEKNDMEITGSHAFTFTLYDAEKKKIKELKITTTDGKTASGSFDGLSQGKTYYLKETVVNAGFAFTGMTGENGSPMTSDPDGYYEITMPTEPKDVSVTAENTYLYAKASIRKVNGETGEYLEGAAFRVVQVVDGQEQETSIKVVDDGDGSYTATFLLKGTQPETYRFYETQAPYNYLKDETHYIEVTVGPGQVLAAPGWNDTYTQVGDREQNNQAMLDDRLFPNYQGAYIDLVKYDNVQGAGVANPQKGADFTLYRYNEDTKEWEFAAQATTDGDGEIHFVVNGGRKYALEESYVPTGWQGLEGIYQNDQKADTIGVTVGNEEKTLHLINGGNAIVAGDTYAYQAYNIPLLDLQIRKENALDPSKRLSATAAVYEVPEGTSLDTDEEVTAFIEDEANKPLESEISVNMPGGSNENLYSYSVDERLKNLVVAGKTYLVVETSASTSQIRENANVQWYDLVEIPEGSRDAQTAVLKNVEGSAALKLAKTAEKKNYTSLFTQRAEVNYTITPTVGTNTYPLKDFTVRDEGLTAYNNGQPLAADILAGKYSLTEVTVGPASHKTSDLAEGIDGPIYATVTFYGANGDIVSTSEKLDVSNGSQTAVLPEGSAKAEKISVSYECTQFKDKTKTEYALGTNFQPGTIQVKAEIDQQTGEEGQEMEIIDQIRNTSEATLHYQEWTPAGTKADTVSELKKTATADVYFGEQEAAIVSVEKTADKTTVNLLDPVVYSITITNDENAPEAMQEPFLVDFLPQGTSWQPYDDENDVLLEAGDTGITVSHMRTGTRQGETGVFVFLNGNLDPGESVTVKLKVMTENAAALYGNTMNNYVLVGSDVSGPRTEENPQGASFMNENGRWAQSVESVTTSMDKDRQDILKEILDEQAAYGYVSDMASVNWTGGSDLVMVKSAYGDQNAAAGYSTDILSTISNGGTMYYRLSVSNASQLYTTTQFTLLDVLPAVGDFTSGNAARDSKWALNFDEITRVYKTSQTGSGVDTTEISADLYHVYYYTGTLDGIGAYQNLYDQAENLGYEDSGNLPSGWVTNVTDKTTIKAFAVALKEDQAVQLKNDEALVVEYQAQPNGGEPWDADILNTNSWQNAVNSFACTYSRFSENHPEPEWVGNVFGSNQVSNTIVPTEVGVGGHIWIDKNNDGIWQKDESISNFQSNYLIGQMLDEIEVRLFTYTGTNPNPTDRSEVYPTTGTDWKSKANYQFTGLIPAMLREGVTEATAYPNGILDPTQLKGSAPSTYTLNVTIPNEVDGKYKVTSLGETSGISRDPRTIAKYFPAETTDNNFTEQNSAAVSEKFYLWVTDPEDSDNTKDIGLVPYRDLKIHKTATDDTATNVEGAKFTVYGPFADENVTEADLTEKKKVANGTTDQNGNLTVEDLLWYQNYVIVEESTAAGYELDGATATGATGTNIAPISLGKKTAWLLKTPEDSKTEPVDTVNITNDRTEVKATLKAEKEYLKNGDEQTLKGDEFTFNLWESLADITTEGKTPLMTANNTADGSVTFKGIDELTYDRPGTHYYYITEQQKDTNPYQGVTYDETIYRATVTVEWVAGKGLETTVIYDKQTGPDAWAPATAAEFTNEYNATGNWTPAVTKTLTGRDMKENETFTIEVVENDNGTETVVATGTVSGGKDGEPVGVVFDDPVAYDLDDVGVNHSYTIREKNAGNTTNGLTYSKEEYEVTVTVTDKGDGTLNVAAVYPDGAKSVNFENIYKPEPITYMPVVTKTVTGNELPADQTFTFDLAAGTFEPEDGAQMPADTQAQIKVAKGQTTGTVTDNNFGAITFKKAGTYTFTITEEKPTQTGFEKYDTSEWTLTVVVSDDGNGKLKQESAVYTKEGVTDGTEAAFTNEYDPTDATVRLQAAKKMTSDLAEELPHDMTFTFEQSYSGEKPDSVLMPEENQVEVTIGNLDTKVDAPKFGEITFTAAGEYTFAIEEVIPAGADREEGVNYDNKIWNVKVKVTDEGGILKASAPVYYLSTAALDNPSDPVFTNTYKTEKTDFTPGISKTLTGDPIPEEKTFTFELTANAGNDKDGFQILDQAENPVEKGTATVTYNAGESGLRSTNFNDIQFSKAGRYSFTINEITDDAAGYQYDTKGQGPWTLTVEIKDKGGALEIKSVSYEDKDGTTVTGENARAEFTNSYTVTDTTYIPAVTKKMTGDPRPGDADFAFTIKPGTSNPEGGATLDQDKEASVTIGKDVDEATVPAADTPTAEENAFGPITFSQAGTYTFIIRETDGDEDGYTYDTDPWTLTVKVEDQDSQLTVTETTYTRGTDSNKTAAVFTNSYETKDSKPFTPEVKKTVTGENRPTGTQTFDFTLTPPAGDGYTIANDDKTATVTVTDNASTGTTTDPFGEIIFTKAGTYEFQIAEEKGSANGYTYDTDPWTLTVKVEDKDSQITVTETTYTRKGDTESTEYATVVNTYAVEPTEFTPVVEKTITGDDRPGDVTFNFELTAKADGFDPADGAVMPKDTTAAITLTPDETEGTSSAAGQDGFGTIRFIHAGTYEFEITETNEGKGGYNYDGTHWILKVTVEDVGGRLQVAADGVQYVKADNTGANEDAALFENSYSTKETKYAPQISKILTGDPTPGDKTFTFTLARNEAAEEEGTPADGAVIVNGQTTITGAGDGNFENITFDKVGTYHFTIAEVPGSDAGYTYDPLSWDLEVVVENQDSVLTVVSHTYTRTDVDGQEVTSDEEATFTNDYEVIPTGYTPTVIKAVTGDDRPDDVTFNFELSAKADGFDPADGVKMPKDTMAAVTLTPEETKETSSAEGQDGFGEIQFIHAGTYEFEITEINDGKQGYGYDTSTWILKVTVEDIDGKLQVAKDGVQYAKADGTGANADAVLFENSYSTEETEYAPQISKILTGDPTPVDKTFNFTLERNTTAETSGTPEDGAVISNDQTTIIGEDNRSFGNITFDKAGTYHFTIAEVPGSDAGYTYDPLKWDLEVVVEDQDSILTVVSHTYIRTDADGQEVTSDEEATFTNEYEVVPTGYTPTVTKAMTGDERPGDVTFSFELSAKADGFEPADGVVMPEDTKAAVTLTPEETKGTSSAAGQDGFGEIRFIHAGTYEFEIRETDDGKSGYGYDGSTWILTVTVEDIGGKLQVAKDGVQYAKADGTGVNADAAAFENRYSTTEAFYDPQVAKVLTGDSTPGNKTFTFTLARNEAAEDEGTPEDGAVISNGQTTITGAGSGNFGSITFDKAGTYHFTIAEVPGSDAGYTYDPLSWDLEVVVEDQDSFLKVVSHTYTQTDADGKEATSKEKATFTNDYEVVPTGYVPTVNKTMTGDERPGDVTFDFELSAKADGFDPADGAVMPEDTKAAITLTAEETKGTSSAAGQDGFGEITFNQAGTYTFIIRETDSGKDGYTYDTVPWTLTVKVEDKDSQLTVTETTYTRAGESNEDAAVFTNSYKTKDSIPFTPEVKKTVTGETRPDGTQTFGFTLTAPEGDGFIIDGNDTKATVTVTDNASTGTTTDPFGAITFTRAGTYEFQIAEEQGSANGYTYDTDPWTLTVVVEDQDSQLKVTEATYTRKGDTESTEFATFVNNYAVEPTEFTPVVEKSMTGDDRPDDVTFEFELTAKADGFDPADGAVMPNDTKAAVTLTPEEAEGTGSAAGQDGFGAIRFVHAGTYEFEITETNDGEKGYGYDGSTWILTVTVEDVDGKLQVAEDGVQYAKADGTGANADAAAFENSYSTTEAAYDPRVAKALTGDPTPVDKTFTFTLARNEAAEDEGTPENGAVISNDRTTITGAGSGSFGSINFDKAGTYHFTIAEVQGSDAGYTYDPLSWDLEVVVEDKDSVLTVISYTYTQTDADGKEVTSDEEATFTNDYEVVPVGYVPTVTKTVTGDVPEGKEARFRFALTAREDNPEGAVLPADMEAAIKGSGEADFDEIVFEQAGTYRFDITEINDQLPGYQYDGSVWTLTVVVKDTDHILGVESAVYTRQDEATSDAADFENHYRPDEAAYAPKVTKHISGDKTPSNATFTFTIEALEDNPEGAAVKGASADVAGAGKTAFAPITFTRAGTYRFDIREADGHEAGYTYDAHSWRLTVEVADEDGVLSIANVKYVKRGSFDSNTESAEFTNRYKSQSTGGIVQTGDMTDLTGVVAVLGTSALFILILLYLRRKHKETE